MIKNKSFWLLTLLCFIFIAEIIFLLWACKRHLDFTDESFYLLSSLYPELFSTRFSDFGYLNAAIMSITGQNLYFLRISGLFILLVSSFGVLRQSLMWIQNKIQTPLNQTECYVWIVTGMIASTGYYFWGMTTPSYNFYALIGILTASTGFIGILNAQKLKIGSVALLAMGMLILYIGKPTSAVFFAFCIGAWLILGYFFKTIQIRELMLPLFCACIAFFILFFAYILLVYGGINAYITHIKNTQQLLSQVGYSSNILKGNIVNSILGEVSKFYFLVPYSLIIVAFLVYQKTQKKHTISSFNTTDKAYFYSVCFLIVFAGFFNHKGISWKWAWAYMAVLYAVIAYFVFYWTRIKHNVKNIVTFVFFLLLMSVAYVFGTNNPFNIALAGIYVAISMALMTITLIIYQSVKNIIPVILCVVLISIFSMSTLGQFFMNPYRSKSKLHEHKNKLDILGGIYIDKHHADYAREMQEIKKNNPDIDKYDYLVDISGKSGANLILNKKYLGQSWIVWGKTDTYYHFANSTLKSVPVSQLYKAILLTNETLPTEKILKNLQLNFPNGYICIGKVLSMPEKEYHLLWIPK